MPIEFLWIAIALAVSGSALAWVLFNGHRRASERGPLTLPTDATEKYSVATLTLASISGLFLELLLIRWISSEIRIFAYFKNFVLVACFLGFGLGFYLCRRAVSLLPTVLSLAYLILIVQLPWRPLRVFIDALPVLLGSTSEVQIWGVGQAPISGSGIEGLLLAAIVTLPLFLLLANTFVPVGQLIGRQMELARNGVAAYSINVAASLAGILLYTALCFASQPPAVWFAVSAALFALLLWRSRIAAIVTAGVMIAAVVMLVAFNNDHGDTHWSPYQKLTLFPVIRGGELVAYDLQTNHSWYQKIINLQPEFIARHPDLLAGQPLELNAYNLPFRFMPRPESTLILGAGMGNDVAAAVRNGSQRVVAVEIDPLIIRLGKKLHFEHPYQSPRVQAIVDDARSYLENSHEQFDLIVFSLLDSHTTNSQFSNIRIDNYVYTEEAFRAAKHLLKPDGVMIVKFQVQRHWIAGRLRNLLAQTFGFEPLHFQAPPSYTSTGRFFVTGSRDRIVEALHADLPFAAWIAKNSAFPLENATTTTDDWPYFYQRSPGIPVSVGVISVLLLLACWFALNRTGVVGRSIDLHFLLLGAGFMLLEAQIISRMALLFGTTWVVNSIVISFILFLIVLANMTATRFTSMTSTHAYIGLFISLVIGMLIPTHRLLFSSVVLRALGSGVLLCLPVFFAGIIFIRSFAAAGFEGRSLGANLLGSLAGGILESISLWSGLRSVLFIAAACYVASMLVANARREGEVMKVE